MKFARIILTRYLIIIFICNVSITWTTQQQCTQKAYLECRVTIIFLFFNTIFIYYFDNKILFIPYLSATIPSHNSNILIKISLYHPPLV